MTAMSRRAGCARCGASLAADNNLREELGLTLHLGPILVVDWVAPHDPWDDSLMVVFDGGVLQPGPPLRPMDGELTEARFVPFGDARALLRPYVWQRVWHAMAVLADGRPRYLVDGVAA